MDIKNKKVRITAKNSNFKKLNSRTRVNTGFQNKNRPNGRFKFSGRAW